MNLREHTDYIIERTIESVMPDEAVKNVLANQEFLGGRLYLVAAGKAAWQMAQVAAKQFAGKLEQGIVVTKYGHVKGDIPGVDCFEAGHPLPDENSFQAAERILAFTKNLRQEDTVLFLLSGGASALFEKPLISGRELQDITDQLLRKGADIVEMNIIRKRLSAVKGGKFAKHCAPARIFSVVLSDVLGDRLDMIASGPACEDQSTCKEALGIIKKYGITISEEALACLNIETPKQIDNVESVICGSVRKLCESVQKACKELGYETVFLTDQLNIEAKEAGRFLASIAKTHHDSPKNLAFIAGGETIVYVKGSGMGGRNQELALSAARDIAGMNNVAIFSVGSDGTDGPTDAAGGYVDGNTLSKLREGGIDIDKVLNDNDAYHGLMHSGGLIKTGATGTNVNDVSVLLILGKDHLDKEHITDGSGQNG